MNITRKCRHCGAEYQYANYANVITFCPECRRQDQLICEYGYGPVAPCRIYLGSEIIGLVTYDNREQTRYRLDSMKYGLHTVLEHTYMEALKEAEGIIAHRLEPVSGESSTAAAASHTEGSTAAAAEKDGHISNSGTASQAEAVPQKAKQKSVKQKDATGTIFLAPACLCALFGAIIQPSGSTALISDFSGVLFLIFLWLYLLIRIRHSRNANAKALKIAVMAVFAAVIIWFAAMPTLDLISGPVSDVIYNPQTERTQGHTGLFSRHYYLRGTAASGETIRVEIAADEYADFENTDGTPHQAIAIEYYEHTGKLIRSEIL